MPVKRPSGSVVAVLISILALFIALGSTAYAAIVITGANIKNGTVTGADVKDKSLGGGDLLTRVARANVYSAAVTGTDAATAAADTSIKAPTRGYLVITASSDVYNSDDPDNLVCWIEVDGTEVGASERVMVLDPTTNHEEDCSTNVTVPVRPGRHTVALIADPGVTTTTFDETALQVVFVAFGPTGKMPTKFNLNPPVARSAPSRN